MNTSLKSRLNTINSLIAPEASPTIKPTYIDCSAEVSPHFKHDSSVETTSGHQYPPELVGLIEQNDGWTLDCGSGSRDRTFDNVVNFEIQPYNGVDVVGTAEQLPFKDGTFDLVISLAVLEHVKDPKKVALEMQRVLKPGGLLWIDTAFLQPYHGFPAHYYNMTQQGLELLLEKNMKVIKNAVPRYGTPIWSITWIISRYAASLPNELREKFLALPLSELLQSPEYLCEEEWSKELPEEARKELAATVSVLARKQL
ncbi:class I SAM-dependent methyltransferase [Pelagicoccus sp. NFK12]|uniref:Class I SAM-dependent methyltransferase n=1 Tax=Pelagicoccus enzymogenes TaxID=2773457 RepID=A0A927F5S5_9BACT|nr:class I SAM-dependent methyltransferase [Pelagicoccus enzymogenes]MBD5778702.1 class I SAM-dependent methyltransferase [Pelagicoccus enzymogenes]